MRILPWISLMFLASTSAGPAENSFRILNTASESGSPTVTLRAVSGDGTTVVGTGANAPFLGSSVAYRASNGVVTWLAPLPGTGSASSRANAVSENGSVVVGSSTRFSINQAARWVNGATSPLALGLPAGWTSSTALAVSDDGIVIAGVVRKTVENQTVRQPFRWSSATGVQVLALPTNVVSGLLVLDEAVFLSADGNVVVARASTIESNRVISVSLHRWVGAGDPETLESFPGATSVAVTGLGADGTTVIGTVTNQACRWEGTTRHALFENGIISTAVAISADGTKILAQTNGVAVRWRSDGVDVLGNFTPRVLSADGNVAAGLRTSSLRAEAMVWDPFNGARSFTDLILHGFTNTHVARYRITTVVGVRAAGGKITLAGNATGLISPYRSGAISDGWVGTIRAPSGMEPDPFEGPLFDRSASFTPSVAFAETLRHTLVAYRVDGFPIVSPLATFTSQLSATVSMEGLDLAALDANTPVELVLGSIAYSGRLGNNPSYAPGKTSARFFFLNGGQLRLSWTSKVLTLSVVFAITETTGEYSPYFDPLRATSVAVPALMSRNSPGSGYLNVEMNFAGRKGRRPVFVSWTATRNSVTRQIGEYPSTFYLNNLAINGQTDYVAPTLRFLAPASKAVLPAPSIPVALSVNDLRTISRVLVKLNDGEFLPANAASFGSVAAWVRMVTPRPGTNSLQAKAIDFSGNESQVISNRFSYLFQGGAYAGLLTGADGVPAGIFTLTLTEGGAFSGKAVLHGKTSRFQGALTEAATAQVLLGDILFNFGLALDGTANVLTGTLTRGGEVVAQINAARRLYDGINTRSPRQGAYTLLLPPAGTTNTPPGYGYAKLVVSANGTGTIVGRLADGTAFTAAAVMDGRDQLPLFVRPYLSGLLAGPLQFRATSLTDLDGTLRWVKPEQRLGRFRPAFSVELPAIGSTLGYLDYNLFLPRDAQTQANARLRFSGGNLISAIDQPVTVGGLISRPYPSPASFTLSSTADGLFTGTFRDPSSNKVRRFRGAILTKPQTAAGFFLGDQSGGMVELLPGFQ